MEVAKAEGLCLLLEFSYSPKRNLVIDMMHAVYEWMHYFTTFTNKSTNAYSLLCRRQLGNSDRKPVNSNANA